MDIKIVQWASHRCLSWQGPIPALPVITDVSRGSARAPTLFLLSTDVQCTNSDPAHCFADDVILCHLPSYSTPHRLLSNIDCDRYVASVSLNSDLEPIFRGSENHVLPNFSLSDFFET